MGLLDSDAEELKKNATSEAKSGRKVNQSGLGAFKGLSKYSNLTAKYRSAGKETPPPAPADSVEQSCGTISKSVQSTVEVSALSVQSECADISKSEDSNTSKEISAKWCQSQCKDIASVLIESIVTSNFDTNAKSVQSDGKEGALSDLEVLTLENIATNTFGSVPVSIEDLKPVQSQCNKLVESNTEQFEQNKVSAKTVRQLETSSEFLSQYTNKNINDLKSVQSQSEDSSKLENNFDKTDINLLEKQPFQVSAKTAQSKLEVSASKKQSSGEEVKNNVSANYVQRQRNVIAKSVQGTGSLFQNNPEMFHGVSDFLIQNNSKCISKNIEDKLPLESVMSLSGSQRVLVEFFYQLCVWNNSLITPPITKQHLVSETGLSPDTALSSIKRLRNKYIIDRHAYKDGKAGWTQYKISETSYKELVHLHQVGGRYFPTRIEPAIMQAGRAPAPSIIPSELTWFKELDFSAVRPIGPMVVNASIRALVQERLQPETVQDFLNKFTSWMTTQGKISSPTGLFCDKLKELAREGDSPVLACMTAAEREADAAFALSVDKARAEIDLIAKSKELQFTQEQATKFEDEYKKWFNLVSADNLRILVPGNAIAPFGSEMHKALVRGHFEENVWPTL